MEVVPPDSEVIDPKFVPENLDPELELMESDPKPELLVEPSKYESKGEPRELKPEKEPIKIEADAESESSRSDPDWAPSEVQKLSRGEVLRDFKVKARSAIAGRRSGVTDRPVKGEGK
ncbi:hypothetical protein NL676_008559 [Syzygium grande]|nr:hypothetical protein NL676_008559 [Syzygium grande]